MTAARERIEVIFRAAVAAVEPRAAVASAIAELRDVHAPTANISDAYVIAIGKAAVSMAAGGNDALGDQLAGGIVVSKEPARQPLAHLTYLQGAHPVPDERSLLAGAAVLDFAAGLPENARVFCLISGGGSALVEALRPGIGLDDLQQTTSFLLRAGAPIEALNAVRARLSRIKGGGLLRALGTRQVVNLIVSDVLGDNLQVIASGPSVILDESTSGEAVVARYRLALELPPVDTQTCCPPQVTRVVANLPKALAAAATAAKELGLRPVILSPKLEGEARHVARTLASILAAAGQRHSPLQPGDCVLAGGETTVTVVGDGVGGRNTEAALAAAIELCGRPAVTVGFLATDGEDAVTGSAGAIVDGATIPPEQVTRARLALSENASYDYLAERGIVFAPGATGTNVNDLVIAIIA